MNNKFMAMVILKPDIQQEQIDAVESGIITLFEQYSKINKIYFLGKKKLDYKIQKFNDGYYLKLEIIAKNKQIDIVRNILQNNEYVIFSAILKSEENKFNLPIINSHPMKSWNINATNNMNIENKDNKVYMLIGKNLKLPFSESNIISISQNKNKILELANKKMQEYIYVKGYKSTIEMKTIKDLERALQKHSKVTFTFSNNSNIGHELLIQEKVLV